MFRIDHATSVAVMPAPLAAGVGGYFSHASPGGDAPTVVTSDWCNGIQEELCSVLAAAGVVPDKAAHDQVLTAINSLIGSAGVVGAGAVHGMTLSNAIGFLTTRVTCSVGLFRDSTNAASGALAAPMTKRLDAVWAVGNNNGGRLSGALANGQTWHCFALVNPLTGDVEAPVFDQSPTAPDLVGSGAAAAGFTKFRWLGAVILEAASTDIRQFKQTDEWFEFKVRSTDYAAQANGAGVPYLRAITVPDGIECEAECYFQSLGTADANPYLSGLFNAAFGPPAAFGGPAQWAQIRRQAFMHFSGVYVSYGTTMVRVTTNSTRQIYTFSSDNAADVIALGVTRWRVARGRFF